MNFDFLKDLSGLSAIYKPCTQAEELALSMPDLSLVSARKGAEILAKFMYMAAHATRISEMTFSDILTDYEVKRFINSKPVMDAFHYIRKSGNSAVHTENEVSSDSALQVVKQLHYLAGECAKALDLLDEYPEFNNDLVDNADVEFDEQYDIDDEVMNMFFEYVKKKDGHFSSFDPFQNDAHADYYFRSIINMHEYLEFSKQPNYKTTLEYIQEYLHFIINSWNARKDNKDCWLELEMTIYINGKTAFSNKTDNDPLNIIYQQLPIADSFAIDIYLYGNLREFYRLALTDDGQFCYRQPSIHDHIHMGQEIDQDSVWQGKGMSEQLELLKRREKFIYKGIFQYPQYQNKVECSSIKNGKSFNILDLLSENYTPKEDSTFEGANLGALIVFSSTPDRAIIHQLRNAVCEYLKDAPEEIKCMEEAWEEHDEDSDYYGKTCWLLGGTWIDDPCLTKTKAFISSLSQILSPIMKQCQKILLIQYEDGRFFVDMHHFSLAAFTLIDNQIKIIGADL